MGSAGQSPTAQITSIYRNLSDPICTMITELDLVQEYSNLNQAKIECWGSLDATYEQRWQELKGFYDNLLASRIKTKVPSTHRFGRSELEFRLPHRASLRVPAEMGLFFCHGDTYAPAKLKNLSQGGLFVASEVAMSTGDILTLYMPNLGGGYDLLFETPVDVVWTSAPNETPRGMGLRFLNLDEPTKEQLDHFITSFLRNRLSKSMAVTRRPRVTRNKKRKARQN